MATIHQRLTHPTPVEGCDRCRWASVAPARERIRQGADPVRRVPVLAEHGPRAGRPSGFHTEHMDGRQDATVLAPHVHVQMTPREVTT